MANVTLTESDQALLRLLSAKQAGAVLHRLLGKEGKLDAGAEKVFLSIQGGLSRRGKDAKRKRKFQGDSMEIPRNIQGDSKEVPKSAPPFLPPSSSPPTPPVSSPPYNPPTTTTSAGAVCADLGAVYRLYLARVNDNPSPFCLDEIKNFVRDLSAPVVGRVISYAIDEDKATWAYIVKALRGCKRNGVTNLALWEKRETEREAEQEAGKMQKTKDRKGILSPTQASPERVQQEFTRLDKLLSDVDGAR